MSRSYMVIDMMDFFQFGIPSLSVMITSGDSAINGYPNSAAVSCQINREPMLDDGN